LLQAHAKQMFGCDCRGDPACTLQDRVQFVGRLPQRRQGRRKHLYSVVDERVHAQRHKLRTGHRVRAAAAGARRSANAATSATAAALAASARGANPLARKQAGPQRRIIRHGNRSVMFTTKREWSVSMEGADKMKPVDRKRAWQRHSRNTSPRRAKQIRLSIVHEVLGSGSSHLTSGNTEPTRACAEATPCDRVASGACAPGAPRFEPPGTEAALRVRVIKTSVTACGLSPIATSDGCRAWANNTRIDAEATSTCTRRHPLFSIISQCDRSGPPIRFAT